MAMIEEYIQTFPAEAQDVVRRIYMLGRHLAPDAEEGISYAVPCLTVGGKAFCGVQKAANHLTFIPFSGAAISSAAEELSGLAITKGTVRFTATTPLPDAAVGAVLRARLAEIAG